MSTELYMTESYRWVLRCAWPGANAVMSSKADIGMTRAIDMEGEGSPVELQLAF